MKGEEDNMLKGIDKNLLPKRITEERKKRGLSQAQLADKAGVTPGAISQIESGQRIPTIPVLSGIAKVLGVSIDYLTGKSEKSELEDLLQQEKVQIFFRGFQELDPEDQKTIIKQIEFMRSRSRETEKG
jgi:transcriptional regulator with XRE-family HTH domain